MGNALLSVAAGSSESSVFITRANRTWSPAGTIAICDNDLIEVAAGSTAVELLFDNAQTRLTLQPETKFRVLSLAPQKRFALDRGTLRADVTRQPNEAPMLIQTPTGEALVLGTVFTLTARSDHTDLTVERGVVRFSQDDGSAENIQAGQSAVTARGTPVQLVRTPADVRPGPQRAMQKWVRGPLPRSAAGEIKFDFD